MRLGRDTGASIAVAEGVGGYVTVELHGVTLPQALRAILEPLGAKFRSQQGVYVIEASAKGAQASSTGGPVVVPLSVVTTKTAAATLRPLFPQASLREDTRANALVIVATAADVQAIRSVLQGIDVRDPMAPIIEALPLRTSRASLLADHLRAAFPKAKFGVAGEAQLLVTASPNEMVQIKATVGALDSPRVTPPPVVVSSEAVPVTRRAPRDVARALASQVPGLKAAVSGGVVMLSGPADAVSRGKVLIAQLDLPVFGDRYTQVYRIRSLDAASVGDLIRRSFHGLEVTVDASLNAVAVVGTAAQQARIADAIAQLDAPAHGAQASTFGQQAAGDGSSTEIVTLKSYVPGQALGGGLDAVASFTQALQVVTPDVRVVQLPTPGQIALLGPAHSVRIAKDFLDKADAVPAMVILDTEVLEVDETVAKNLGLQFGSGVVSSTFTEVQPPPNADGTPGRLGRFQALSRTPISFTAQLNLLIQNGKGRVLADPRITTLSGRTASIRAGDTISILTTTAGNAGTIATTQVQSFQTGVTLDITPSVTADGGITVHLHPVVNSLIGTNAGVPEISTRDTQTTVHLHDDETLVIGGLIQESDTRTTTKVPILGDLPLLGRVFRNENVQGQRNELIIVVTPHIVKPGKTIVPGPALQALPTPPALPTLPPNTNLPSPSGQLPAPHQISTVQRATETPHPTVALSPGPSSTPSAVPTAFAQTNVFTFGSPPQNNFARPSDPVQIFYATLSPTVVTDGASVRVAVVTTTNVSAVKLNVGSVTVALRQTASGQWQATFPFPLTTVPTGQTSLSTSLVASRVDGTSATVPIPISANRP
jgi:type II secretory pathway component GspD/PulD (secretin)